MLIIQIQNKSLLEGKKQLRNNESDRIRNTMCGLHAYLLEDVCFVHEKGNEKLGTNDRSDDMVIKNASLLCKNPAKWIDIQTLG